MVTMSPPLPDSSPCSVTMMAPSLTAQPVVGKPPPRALRSLGRLAVKEQPQAFAFSFGVSVFASGCENKGCGEEHTQAERATDVFIQTA